MKTHLKEIIRNFITSIGGIEAVRKDLRTPLIKHCIAYLTIYDNLKMLDKVQVFYPLIGTMKPMEIPKFNLTTPAPSEETNK